MIVAIDRISNLECISTQIYLHGIITAVSNTFTGSNTLDKPT